MMRQNSTPRTRAEAPFHVPMRAPVLAVINMRPLQFVKPAGSCHPDQSGFVLA
jgi:hypothetical protein